jgi:hypothetical protein
VTTAERPVACNVARGPEFTALREVRSALGRGGLPSPDQSTPQEQARLASFRTLEELLRILDEYRRRIESGERCRLVEREHERVPGQLLVELVIEEVP